MIQYSYGIEVKYMMKLIESDRYELKYNYMITDNGEVYSPIYKRFLKPSSDRYGYDQVWLACKDKRRKFLVHRLVMENFSPIEICKLLQTKKYTNKQIANMFNIFESCIEGIRERRNWKHITKDIIF